MAGPAFDHLARTFGAIGASRETRRLLGYGFGDSRNGSLAEADGGLPDPAVNASAPHAISSNSRFAEAAPSYDGHAEVVEASGRSLIAETEMLRHGAA